jgi:hypothetical protein
MLYLATVTSDLHFIWARSTASVVNHHAFCCQQHSSRISHLATVSSSLYLLT